MEATGKMLADLARSEKALEQSIADAKSAAQKRIEAARAEAQGIFETAQRQMKALDLEFEQKLATESERIGSEARSSVSGEVEAVRAKADTRMAQAVQLILKAVAP